MALTMARAEYQLSLTREPRPPALSFAVVQDRTADPGAVIGELELGAMSLNSGFIALGVLNCRGDQVLRLSLDI